MPNVAVSLYAVYEQANKITWDQKQALNWSQIFEKIAGAAPAPIHPDDWTHPCCQVRSYWPINLTESERMYSLRWIDSGPSKPSMLLIATPGDQPDTWVGFKLDKQAQFEELFSFFYNLQ